MSDTELTVVMPLRMGLKEETELTPRYSMLAILRPVLTVDENGISYVLKLSHHAVEINSEKI